MRLTRIRIAGFKSFVDPTDLKLPGSLVGIVGPNGCGKSNTIDAVRWVMGESSAKHLRGESMDDVIFTGSSSRKPVGQASVELVFDNSDGSLGGEYAAYAEIAVKREVSRDGQSRYLMNGTRCRRRDIRDLFLGTGLGPRSYAIIEQGMISRLIEAKPEDLRVFLEEAAGISKYKERRRETETRIRHTRDNLDRLDDLREEVDKQLEKLKRQASTAERYQALRAEERIRRGQLLGLRRRAFAQQHAEQSGDLSSRETELEAVVTELRAAQTSIERARLQQVEAADRFGIAQQAFYQVGSEVARLEQSIAHARTTRAERSRELAETDRALSESRLHLEQDSQRIAGIVATIEGDLPAFDALAETQKAQAEALQSAESALAAWQARRDAWAGGHSDAQRTAQVERSRADQLERSVDQARQRLAKLDEEADTLDVEPMQEAIEELVEQELVAADEETSLEARLSETGERRNAVRDQLKQLGARLDEAKARRGAASGRLASLEALQQAALEPEGDGGDAWLREQGLHDAPRLGSRIQVAEGWERAVEVVLAGRLEAVCVQDADRLQACARTELVSGLTLLEPGDGTRLAQAAAAAMPLERHVTGHGALGDLLAGVFAVEDLDAALHVRDSLVHGQSVVTRDGVQVGRLWLRTTRADAQDSVLLRARQIDAARDELDTLDASIDANEGALEELGLTQQEHETRRETLLHDFNDAVRRVADLRSRLRSERQRLDQTQARSQRVNQERDEARQVVQRDEAEWGEAVRLRADALRLLETLSGEQRTLDAQGASLREALGGLRRQVDQQRDDGQQLAIRVESMKSARQATEQNLTRTQQRIGELTTRRDELDRLFATDDEDPIQALEDDLEAQIGARLETEDTLKRTREALEEVESRLREHEQARVRHDGRSQGLRERLTEARMAAQEVVVRLKTLDEQIVEQDYDASTLLDEVPDEADIPGWEAEVQRLEQRIHRLGPINLAAIDEHAEQLQRKEYLDTQHADVSEALETLERAIAKIDRETRSRFRETYEAVDQKFTAFFPRLFGGGNASLQLTGDDLLSTGVSVLAQPPGKRVTNIQLLSGGEKALTAVALVFAFFELNPSPFCMLDEVDAPLDDANVGRFCALVREMSERVQFIFITHNKVTMEMAEQLMGVTMNEPGVSRLVAVDVQEAVALAGA